MFRFYYRPIKICDSESLSCHHFLHDLELLNMTDRLYVFSFCLPRTYRCSSPPVHLSTSLFLSLLVLLCLRVRLWLFGCVSLSRLSHHRIISLFIFLPLLLSICIYIRLPVFLSVFLSFHLSVWEFDWEWTDWLTEVKESEFQVYGRPMIAWK